MMVRKRTAKPAAQLPSDDEIVTELEDLSLGYLRWGLVNTQDKAPRIDALPRPQQLELKEKLGLPFTRLPPKKLTELKKRKARGSGKADSSSAEGAGAAVKNRKPTRSKSKDA